LLLLFVLAKDPATLFAGLGLCRVVLFLERELSPRLELEPELVEALDIGKRRAHVAETGNALCNGKARVAVKDRAEEGKEIVGSVGLGLGRNAVVKHVLGVVLAALLRVAEHLVRTQDPLEHRVVDSVCAGAALADELVGVVLQAHLAERLADLLLGRGPADVCKPQRLVVVQRVCRHAVGVELCVELLLLRGLLRRLLRGIRAVLLDPSSEVDLDEPPVDPVRPPRHRRNHGGAREPLGWWLQQQ